MATEIRVELKSRDGFWKNAFHVEWQHQYPDRKLSDDGLGFLLVAKEWLPDLQRVGLQCFSTVRLAPNDPGRRAMFRRVLPGED